jgi:aldehyde dehydrogenase (NAD+)
VAINQAHGLAMQVPFGGFKESGVGREGGRGVMMHYLQEKSILIKSVNSIFRSS